MKKCNQSKEIYFNMMLKIALLQYLCWKGGTDAVISLLNATLYPLKYILTKKNVLILEWGTNIQSG